MPGADGAGGASEAASVAAVSMRGCQPPRAAKAARAGANNPLCGSSITASRGVALTDASQLGHRVADARPERVIDGEAFEALPGYDGH